MAQTSSFPTTDLEIGVRADKSLEIRWKGAPGESYELEIRYFELGGPMIQPDHSTRMEVTGLAAHVPHPESLSRASAWVVKFGLRVKSEEGFLSSEAVVKQIAWEDELSATETKADLQERITTLIGTELEHFVAVKGIPDLLLIGPQHHGKSSFANHLYRCFMCDLSVNDQMDVAPAGVEEKTVATKSLKVPLKGSDIFIKVTDTPAFANMSAEAAGKLQTLCSTGSQDSRRRQNLAPDERSWFSKPPHGAIVIVSFGHWRDQKDEMQTYLQKAAAVFKNASGGQVDFPYVVVCTHCDVFLRDCQKEDPAKELQKAVDGIKKAALTEHVYPITSYKKNGLGSVRNNEATFGLVSQLLTKAERENTAKVREANIRLMLTPLRWLMKPFLGLAQLVVAVGRKSVKALRFDGARAVRHG
eukprot:Skav231906  [mRNA]  locus=scaffold3410:69743:70990:+ [translate_table: standard]